MKKICLLLIPLLLCSCGNKSLKNTYQISSTNKDGYIYSVNIEYESGDLVLSRYKGGDEIVPYKSYSIGNYEIAYTINSPLLYDYGDYAIWLTVRV